MLTIIETIHVIVEPNYTDGVTQLALGKLIFDIIPFSVRNKTALYTNTKTEKPTVFVKLLFRANKDALRVPLSIHNKCIYIYIY